MSPTKCACAQPRPDDLHQRCDRCGDLICEGTRVVMVDVQDVFYVDDFSDAIAERFVRSELLLCCVSAADLERGLTAVRGPRPQPGQWR